MLLNRFFKETVLSKASIIKMQVISLKSAISTALKYYLKIVRDLHIADKA